MADCRYGYDWQESEAKKNILRTHTTAISAQMLYRLSKEVRGIHYSPSQNWPALYRNESHLSLTPSSLSLFHSPPSLYLFADDQCAGKEFRPVKLFSIDRVFRNETLDATHLAEFHQVYLLANFFPFTPFFALSPCFS